jgi:trehalose transport system substrate-binding protein
MKKTFFFFIFFIFTSLLINGAQTLNISASIGEEEWKVLREYVFPDFEKKHDCRIRAVNIEAGDTLKKIEIMHRANNMGIDVLFLDNMNLAPYVEKRLVLTLERFRNLMDNEVYPALVEPLEYNDMLMFFPGRPNVQITYYNTDVFDDIKYKIPKTCD